MVLVTGGTGFIGSYLLCFLAQRKYKIRALYRATSDLNNTRKIFSYYNVLPLFEEIEWIEADLVDVPALANAFSGVQQVYHAAAVVSFDNNRFKEIKKVNIEGTAQLVNLSLKHGVQKFCHVSSVAALGEHATVINEETHWNPDADNHVYGITKYGAEMEVWRGSQEGLPVVIVNPSIVLGAGFWQAGSGRLFSRINNGLKYYLPGTMGFVDVEDVARVMIQLMESDICNERFVLNAANLPFREVMATIAEGLGKKAPAKPASKRLLHALRWLDIIRNKLSGYPREIFKPGIESAFKNHHYSSAKLDEKTGFTFRPLSETLQQCCLRFLSENKV